MTGADYTQGMAFDREISQVGNLERRAAQKRADRRKDRRRLEEGASRAEMKAENSAFSSNSFSGARIANLWESMGK